MRELRIAVIVLAAILAVTLVGGALLFAKVADTANDVEAQAHAHCKALDDIHDSLVAFVHEHNGITRDLHEVGVHHEMVNLRDAVKPLNVKCDTRGGFSVNHPAHDHSDHRGGPGAHKPSDSATNVRRGERGSQGGDRSQTGSTSPPSSQPGPPSGGSPGDGGGSPPDDGGAPSPPGGSPPSPPNPPSPGPGPSPPSPPPNPPAESHGGVADTVDQAVDNVTDNVCDLTGGVGVNVPGVCK